MKNYPKTCFDKSKCFNKRKADKTKKICSNQIVEPTFSKHVLEINVDSIEKFIHSSLQGGPFGGPVCPPVDIYRVLEDESREKILSFLDSIVDDGVSSDKCKQEAKVNLKNIPTFLTMRMYLKFQISKRQMQSHTIAQRIKYHHFN